MDAKTNMNSSMIIDFCDNSNGLSNSNSSIAIMNNMENNNNSNQSNVNADGKKKPRDPFAHRRVEKTRRDRMNLSLNRLSSIIPESFKKQMFDKGITRVDKIKTVDIAMAYVEFLQAIIKTNNLNEELYISKLNSDDKSLPAQQINHTKLTSNAMKNPTTLIANMLNNNKVNASTNTSLLNSNDENLWYIKGLFNGSIEFMSYLIESFHIYLNEINFETYKIEIFLDILRKFHAIYFKASKLNEKEVKFVTKSYKKKKFPLNNKKLLKKILFILNSEYQVPKKYFDDIIRNLKTSSTNKIKLSKHKHTRHKRTFNHKNMLANSNDSASLSSNTNSSSSSEDSDSETSTTDNEAINDCESLNSTKSSTSLKTNETLETFTVDINSKNKKLIYNNEILGQNNLNPTNPASISTNNINNNNYINSNVQPIQFQYQPNYHLAINQNEHLHQHQPQIHHTSHHNLMQNSAQIVDNQLNMPFNPLLNNVKYGNIENDRLSTYSTSTHLSSMTERASDITSASNQQSNKSFQSLILNESMQQCKTRSSQLSDKEDKRAKKLKSNLIERFNDTTHFMSNDDEKRMKLNGCNRMTNFYNRHCSSSPIPKEDEIVYLPTKAQNIYDHHNMSNSDNIHHHHHGSLNSSNQSLNYCHRHEQSRRLNKTNQSNVNHINESRFISNDIATDLLDENSNMVSIFILHSSQDFYISACLDESLIDNYLLTSIVKNNSFKPKTLHKIKLDVLFASNIMIKNNINKSIMPSPGGSSAFTRSAANSDISKSTISSQRGQNNQYDNNNTNNKYDSYNKQVQSRCQDESKQINQIKNIEYQIGTYSNCKNNINNNSNNNNNNNININHNNNISNKKSDTNLEYRVLESYLKTIKSTSENGIGANIIYKNYSFSHNGQENDLDQHSEYTFKTV